MHDTYFSYIDSLGDGSIRMMRTSDTEREFVAVKGVVPVPTLLRGRVANVIEELRTVVEHVLMTAVEAALGRDMSSREQAAIEMPHRDSPEKLIAWAGDRRRSSLGPIHTGGDLFGRLDALQPYDRTARPELHPLSLIAEFSNETKHRRPLRIAVLSGSTRRVPTLSLSLMLNCLGRCSQATCSGASRWASELQCRCSQACASGYRRQGSGQT